MNAATDGRYELDHELDPGETDGEPAELMPYERAQELSEHFEDIGRRTIAPGVVLGRVVSIDSSKNNAKIAVDVDVPAEPDAQRTFFDKPKSWDRGYAFVRFVEGYGYSRSNFAAMIEDGVEVKVKRQEDDYEIVVPKNTRERTRSRLSRITAPFRRLFTDMDPSKPAVFIPVVLAVEWLGAVIGLGMAASGDILVASLLWVFWLAMWQALGIMAAVDIGSIYFNW